MGNVISFTLSDIGMFVLWGLLIIILYYIIIILKDLYFTLKKVNEIIKDNQKSVDKILVEAPELTQNIKNISKEVSDTLIKFRGTVDNVAASTEDVTKTIKENQTLNKQLTSIFHTISMIRNLFTTYFRDIDTKDNE
ncbi:MAG: hypothetical protein U9N10_03240 [Bacillota bacterium]|nr:hypothetical protein [Bacillota bacterium]